MARYDYYANRKISGVGKYLNKLLAKFIINQIILYTKEMPNPKVLEIGSGNGLVAKMLPDNVEYTGYEPNTELYTRLCSEGFKVVNSKIPPIPENDSQYDIVTAIHVLEHMSNAENFELCLTEIYRILKPGGTFICICPDQYDLGIDFFNADYTHNYITTPNRVLQNLKDKDFRILEKKFIYGAIHSFPGFFLSKIIKFLFLFIRPIEHDLLFEIKGIYKLKFLFMRAFFIACQKK